MEEIGSEVSNIKVGDKVIAPFVWSDNTCDFCREGFQTSCKHGGHWNENENGIGGGQAEYIRVPQADGTLVKIPEGTDEKYMPSLLTLSDVFCTGFHGAHRANVNENTNVTVIGDGAVGLLAVMSAKLLNAKNIFLMGRHETRTNLGIEFGADEIIPERGDEGVEHIKSLTEG